MSQSTSTIVAGRPPLVPVTWAGLKRPVHEGIVDQFQHIIRQWEARGGQDAYLIYSWWGFASRPNNAGAHPRGVGIDINPADNPMVAKRGRCPSDMPEWFIDLWKAQGFGWGGDWKSKCDAMHMSKMPNEGGNGRIYEAPFGAVTPTPQEDDDMGTTAYHQFVPPDGKVHSIGFPPPDAGHVGAVWVSLSSDFGGSKVRGIIGAPGAWLGMGPGGQPEFTVPAGRHFAQRARPGAQMATIVNHGPEVVGVLVELVR